MNQSEDRDDSIEDIIRSVRDGCGLVDPQWTFHYFLRGRGVYPERLANMDVKKWKFPTPEMVGKEKKNRNDLEVLYVLTEIVDNFNRTGHIAYTGMCMYLPVADGVHTQLSESGWDCDVELVGTYNSIPAYTIRNIRPKEAINETLGH